MLYKHSSPLSKQNILYFLFQIFHGGSSFWHQESYLLESGFRICLTATTDLEKKIWPLSAIKYALCHIKASQEVGRKTSLYSNSSLSPWTIYLELIKFWSKQTNLNKYLLASMCQLPFLAADKIPCPSWAYILIRGERQQIEDMVCQLVYVLKQNEGGRRKRWGTNGRLLF